MADLTPGQAEEQRLQDAGFTGPEILAHRQDQMQTLRGAGFSEQEVEQHFGLASPPDAHDGLRRIADHQASLPEPPEPSHVADAMRAGIVTAYQGGSQDIQTSDFDHGAISLLGEANAGGYVGEGQSRRFQPNAAAQRVSAHMLDLYRRTGLTPDQQVALANHAPEYRNEILGHDGGQAPNMDMWSAAKAYFGQVGDAISTDAQKSWDALSDQTTGPLQASPWAGIQKAMDLAGILFAPATGALRETAGRMGEAATSDPVMGPLSQSGILAAGLAPLRANQAIEDLAASRVPDMSSPRIPAQATGDALAMILPLPKLPRVLRGAARAGEEMPREAEAPPGVTSAAPPPPPPLRGMEPDMLAPEGGPRPRARAGLAAMDEHAAEMTQIEGEAAARANVGRAPSPHGDLGLNQIAGLEGSQASMRAHNKLHPENLISESQVVSPAGAIGRYQVMPATARGYGFSREQLFDPQINEQVAKSILGDLRRRFPGDPEAQAIAYNAGPHRAYQWIAHNRNDSVLPRETQGYVGRLRSWGEFPGRTAHDVLEGNYRDQEVALNGWESDWVPPDGGEPPEPPKPPEGGVESPPGGPRKISGHGLNEDMLSSIIRDQYAPDVAREPWYRRYNPRRLLADWQSELSNIKLTGASPHDQLTVTDMFRQRYASVDRVGEFVKHGPVDPITFEPTGAPSWEDAYRAVKEDGGTSDGFRDYRNAQRTLEKIGQGIENPTGIDPDIARQFVGKTKQKYERGAQVLAQFKDGVVDYATQSGVFTERGGQGMKDLNRYHINQRRLIDPQYVPPGARPRTRFGSTKRFEGSERLILDQDVSEFDNMVHMIAKADHNRAVSSFVEAVKRGEVAEAGVTIDREATANLRRLRDERAKAEVLDEDGKPIPEAAAKAANEWGELGKGEGKLGGNKFVVYENGNPTVYRFDGDPEVFKLLTYPWPGKDNPIVGAMAGVAKWARSGIANTTGFIEKVFIRNNLQAAVIGEDVSAPFVDFIHGIGSAIKNDEAMRDLVRKGGANASIADIDRLYLRNKTAEVMQDKGILGRTWNAMNPYNWAQTMRVVTRTMDNASRVGLYKNLTAKGVPPIKAAMKARTAFLDHAEGQTAAYVNTWSRLTVFMRSSIKDIEQLGDALKTRPASTIFKGIAYVTLPTVANYLLNQHMDQYLPEDQKYANIPQWQKDLFWVLPPIGGVRLRIPRPFTVGFLFGTVPERILGQLASDDPRAFRKWSNTFMQQFMIPFMPALAQPAYDQISNTNFSGAPLVPTSLEVASGYMQYKPDTSETAKGLSRLLSPEVGLLSGVGKGIEASPIVLDNYMKGWTGSLPYQVLKVLESPWHEDNKPWEVADLPFVGAFIARNPAMGAQPIQDFYDSYHQVLQAHRDLSLALEHGDMSEIHDSLRFQAFLRLSSVATGLKQQAVALRAIQADKSLTDAERQKYMDGLYEAMILTAKGGLAAVDSFGQHNEQP